MRGGRGRLALLGATLLAGCGGDDGPRWIPLARLAPTSGGVATADGLVLRLADGAPRLEAEVARDAWRRGPDGVAWEARQPVLAIGRAGDAPPYRLVVDGAEIAPGTGAEEGAFFAVNAGRLRLWLPGGADPPEEALLSALAAHAGDAPAVCGRRVSGEGLVVWPGARTEVACELPPDAALRFATAIEPAFLRRAERLGTRVFRVTLDGVPLFEHEESGEEALRWHEVRLPAGGGRVRLGFEVSGSFAYTAFLDPVVGPAEVGVPGARPWGASRPDLVLFVADTFRADNLGVHGNELGLTPRIDRFAQGALRFPNAWSTATATLQAHGTMFTGYFPRQVGLGDFGRALADGAETLAEILGRAGYRTAAVSDGVMVSAAQGLHQGFASFDERRSDLDGTLARVATALQVDDGRPLLLFVQSYATHSPYVVEAETAELLADRLDTRGSFAPLLHSLEQESPGSTRVALERPGARETVEALRRLYLGTVPQLDRGFGQLVDELADRGRLEHAFFVLTSDHGEAFGEHGELFHAGRTFEEQLRVPLLLAGPDIASGVEPRPVSLVDLAPTLLELAGLVTPRDWPGHSLLGPGSAGAVYAFQCRSSGLPSTLAVIDGERKLIGWEDAERRGRGEWLGAFDLMADPAELTNLLGRADWPERLAEEHAAALERMLVPIVRSETVSLSADELRELADMGYVGGE